MKNKNIIEVNGIKYSSNIPPQIKIGLSQEEYAEYLQLKNDSIPKQKIRLELEKVTEEIKEVEKKHLKARTVHNQELWRCVLIRLDERIKVYEELLR